MRKRKEPIALVVADFVTLNLAWTFYYWLRVDSGMFPYRELLRPTGIVDYVLPMLAVFGFWLIVFWFHGLYRPWYEKSGSDEFSVVFRAVTTGTIIAFVLVSDSPANRVPMRYLMAMYWMTLLASVMLGRFVLRLIQRSLFRAGIGLKNTIVLGSAQKAKDLINALRRQGDLGYGIIGFVPIGGDGDVDGVRTLGPYESLERVIAEHDVRELLVALDSRDHATLMDVIAKASYSRVGIKIMPDMYDIVSGQARVTQLRGVPLIDVSPRLLPAWEDRAKRLLDLVVSSLVLVIGLPIWLLISIIIKVGSRGPIMYSQDRVGRDRIPFRIFKFRTMVFDAEKEGPAWAQRNDPRVTNFGRFLRRTHLDEFPQFWNVLIGEMSIVGPRPERPFFVEQIEREIPYYHRRFCVRPGITGWYQMKVDRYDANLADVEERLRYDFYYIENMSLRMDLRILFGTAYTMIRGRGQA